MGEEVEDCGYGSEEQDELYKIMNEVVLSEDILEDIEMFASGIAVGIEVLAAENRTFARELDKNSNLLRSLGR